MTNMEKTLADVRRCEMCGAPLDVDACERLDREKLADMMERVRHLAEWALWINMTNKGFGSLVKVLCAAIVNPCASQKQLAAVAGLSRGAMRAIESRLRRDVPHVHGALWPRANSHE